MERNLDGCYFRIRRGEKYEDLCFSDLTSDEQEAVLKDRPRSSLSGLPCILRKPSAKSGTNSI